MLVGGELIGQFTSNHEPSLGIQPIEEKASSRGGIVTEYFTRYVGVNYGAHSEVDRPTHFVHEELPVTRRRIQHVPHLIQPQGVNIHLQPVPLKVED